MAERAPPPPTLVVRERKGRVGIEAGFASGTLLGSYRILNKIGEGSVGRVYLAEHTKIGRKVAIKVLREELSANTKLVKRFFDEARTVNEIAHENIVAITDFFDDGGKAHFIMELLEGQTLAQLLSTEGVLSVELAVSIMRQLLSALKAVHKKGIVHRDLKPANIFLARREEQEYFVKLLDFGTAKLVTAEGAGQTGIGDLCGTPDYMSPEQSFGMEVDHRSDIYSAGLIFYEMLTGERALAFGHTIGETLAIHQLAVARPVSSIAGLRQPIPAKLEALVMKCLVKDLDARYQSAAELKSDLEAVAQQVLPELQLSTLSTSVQIVRVPERASMVYVALAIIAGAVVAIAGVSAILLTSSKPREVQPSIAIPVNVPVAPAVEVAKEPVEVAEPVQVMEPVEVEVAVEPEAAPAKKMKRVKRQDKTLDENTTINPF